jgi:PIN domain nuclease of toxin-antitoxin system
MAEAVADASAVLACILDEPGCEAALQCRLLVCAVNHAEIVGKLIDRGMGRRHGAKNPAVTGLYGGAIR